MHDIKFHNKAEPNAGRRLRMYRIRVDRSKPGRVPVYVDAPLMSPEDGLDVACHQLDDLADVQAVTVYDLAPQPLTPLSTAA